MVNQFHLGIYVLAQELMRNPNLYLEILALADCVTFLPDYFELWLTALFGQNINSNRILPSKYMNLSKIHQSYIKLFYM